MIARRLPLLLALAALAGCGGKPAPRPAPAKADKAAATATTAASAEEAKKPAEPEWTYSYAGNKRDPFRSYFSELAEEKKKPGMRCSTALGGFEIDQLKLVAVVTGLEDPVAMVEAPTGVGYTLRRGACIGKNGGRVVAVRGDGVVIAETVIRGDGTQDTAQTVLRLPKQAALTTEESP